MGRKSSKEIVRGENIWTEDEIYDLEINEIYIEEAFQSPEVASVFLARLGVIQNIAYCDYCPNGTKMRFVKRSSNSDGFIWNCTKPCTSSKSIRSKTLFEICRLKMKKIMKIIYKYIQRVPFLDIAYDLKIDRKTASLYSMMCRDAIISYITSSSERIGGLDPSGLPKIVEIDESLFFRAKYNRGNHTPGQWYVGGIERGTKKAFLVPVLNRNTNTILQIIQDNVHPNTIIITDQWRAYEAALRQLSGFEHRTVNHSINFVNPASIETHTQTIEGFWSLSKRFLRSRNGINQDEHAEYLLQFLWEHKIERNKRINKLLVLFRLNR